MKRFWLISLTLALALVPTHATYTMPAPDVAQGGKSRQAQPVSQAGGANSAQGPVKSREADPSSANAPITRATLIEMASKLKSLVPNAAAKQVVRSGNGSSLKAALTNSVRRLIDSQSLLSAHAGTGVPRDWAVQWNAASSTPAYITIPATSVPQPALSASATVPEKVLAFVAAHSKLFKLDNPYEELIPAAVIEEENGRNHVQFGLQYQGIPVWGQSLVAHLNADGNLYTINARYSPTPKGLDVTSRQISDKRAIEMATTDLSRNTEILPPTDFVAKLSQYQGATAEPYVWTSSETNKPHLIWHVQIRPNVRDWWYYFVDAHTGTILEKYLNTQSDGPVTGNGTDLLGQNRLLNVYDVGPNYYMIDGSRSIWQPSQPDILNDPKGALWTIDLQGQAPGEQLYHVSSSNNTWTDATSVSAHHNVGRVFEYFLNTHGRNSIDDQGGTVVSVIHVADGDGSGMDNAFWNGWGMYYGDGQSAFTPLAKSLDVAAHEMAHGVTEKTVNLEYKFQSGALNESYSDVYGVLVDNDDWRLGEDVVVPAYFPSGALRDMADPHNGGSGSDDNGWQPSHMNEFQNLSIDVDNGGVHVNSGIPNKAAYLIGNALGRNKLGAIYYRVQQFRFLNSQSNFCDMRIAAIASASDLYGNPSPEVSAVESAFDAVGILGDCGGQLPPDEPPTPTGNEWVAAANAVLGDNSLYLARPVIDSEDDIVQLTATEVNTGTGKPLDVAYPGGDAVIIFVDSDLNLRVIAPNPGNPQEEIVGNQGVWWSVAVSGDFGKVALTTVDIDSMIHILDLDDPGQSKSIRLFSPSTQPGQGSFITQYADVMDWDPYGEYIIYDAFNKMPLGGGGTVEYWEINSLLVQEESIVRLFAPQPEGVSFGNPSFAQSSAVVFAFDAVDVGQCTNNIAAANLYTGDAAVIEPNGCAPGGFPNLGFPRYSPNGSGMVVQWINSSEQKTLWQIPMNATNLMQATGSSTLYVVEAQLPVWLASEIVSDVEHHDDGSTIPERFTVKQNFPNPFNAGTVIEYATDSWGTSRLEIFNVLGQRLVVFEQSDVAPGKHSFYWDGTDDAGSPLASGVYLYRVTSGGSSYSRKMVLVK